MTPSGSFHGSKRDTWVTSGRSVRMPIHSSTWRAVVSGSARFLGLRGSIAGGMISTTGVGRSVGTNSAIVNTEVSYSARNGRRKLQMAAFAFAVSMCERQIQRAWPLPVNSSNAAGCGSWTKMKS